MRSSVLGLLAGWVCVGIAIALAPIQVNASSPPLRLDATAASEWAQSPKLSPDGRAIAYIVGGPDGRQRIEVRGIAKPQALSATRRLSPEIRVYWLNWVGDYQLDVRVSERGGKEQILRWSIPNDSTVRVLPEGAELRLTFSSSFNNFASPIERFSLGKRIFAYEDRGGALLDAVKDIIPAECSEDGSRIMRVFGDPQQMTWELTSKDQASATSWRLVVTPEDRRQGTSIMSVSTNECAADFADSVGRDTLAIRRLDLKSGAYTTLYEGAQDPVYVSVNPLTGLVDVVGVEDAMPHAVGLSAESRRTIEKVAARFPKGYYIVDRSVQNRFWLVRHGDETCDPVWSVVDVNNDREVWSTAEPTKKWRGTCQRTSFAVTAADEPRIGAILTAPADKDCKKATCDLVVVLHGGPTVRDRFLAEPLASELAGNGYMVLNVNFRGSSGFGKAFATKDIGNWGSGIPRDVYAAVDALDAQGYRLGRRIAFGSSFGGYLSLLAATRDQKVDCAVAQSSPPDLIGFIRTMETLTYGRTDLFARVGNPNNAAQAEDLRAISPITYASRGKASILLINGGKDVQSPLDEVKAFAKLRAETAPLSMFVFSDEGHDIADSTNRSLFLSLVAQFIARCSDPHADGIPISRPSDQTVKYYDGIQLLRNN